jgi:hypothetical protein
MFTYFSRLSKYFWCRADAQRRNNNVRTYKEPRKNWVDFVVFSLEFCFIREFAQDLSVFSCQWFFAAPQKLYMKSMLRRFRYFVSLPTYSFQCLLNRFFKKWNGQVQLKHATLHEKTLNDKILINSLVRHVGKLFKRLKNAKSYIAFFILMSHLLVTIKWSA